MARREVIAAALLGIGVACFSAAWLVRSHQRASFAERPPASGEVGVVLAYAQTPNGPVRLQPGRLKTLRRPQYIAFQLKSGGSGPRIVRLELEGRGERVVLHQETLETPADYSAIDYVLELDESTPDDVTLHVALESPHAMTIESTYPMRLFGSQKDEMFPTSPDAGEAAVSTSTVP